MPYRTLLSSILYEEKVIVSYEAIAGDRLPEAPYGVDFIASDLSKSWYESGVLLSAEQNNGLAGIIGRTLFSQNFGDRHICSESMQWLDSQRQVYPIDTLQSNFGQGEMITLALTRLTPADPTSLVGSVATTPHGFLAEASMDDILAILDCPENSASIGAWVEGRLVAYALCVPEASEVFFGSPLIRCIQRRAEPPWCGKGTVVDPKFEGRMLMPRLLAWRYRLIREHSTLCHSAGMIAVDNISSLVGALRAGSWAVGLEDDHYCRNLVHYRGTLAKVIAFREECALAIDDLDGLSARFTSGWVGTGVTVDRTSGQRKLILRQATIEGQPLG